MMTTSNQLAKRSRTRAVSDGTRLAAVANRNAYNRAIFLTWTVVGTAHPVDEMVNNE